jgi:hypothetical protein
VKELVDHIDYAVKLIGVDHVGIASDFDGGGGIEGWDSAADTVNVTIELVRRGYSEDDIAKAVGQEPAARLGGGGETRDGLASRNDATRGPCPGAQREGVIRPVANQPMSQRSLQRVANPDAGSAAT